MKAQDIMTTEVVTASPDTTYKRAVDLMLSAEVSGLPVVDQQGVMVGIVTEADLVAKPAYANGRRRRPLQAVADLLSGVEPAWVKRGATTVADIMTTDLVWVSPDEPVDAVARKVLAARVKRVPVLDDDGHLLGVVSRHDLLGSYLRPDQLIADDVQRSLGDPFLAPETAHVTASVDQGVVTLRGDVQWPSDRRVVTGAVWRVPGVVDVIELLASREEEPSWG